ncbi:MAG: hypothetical protein FWH53_04110 [Leptospirales bacterium]|nr:hypothetical protein [Leptospirales bacterium]
MKFKNFYLTFMILVFCFTLTVSIEAEHGNCWSTEKITVNFEKLGTREINVCRDHDGFSYYFSVKRIDGREYFVTEYSIFENNLGLSTGLSAPIGMIGSPRSRRVIESRTLVKNFTELQFKNTVTDMAGKAYLREGNNGAIYVIVLREEPSWIDFNDMTALITGNIYLLIGEIE